LIVGGVALSFLGLSFVVWNVLVASAPAPDFAPASESSALPPVSVPRETAIITPVANPEPSSSTIVAPTAMPVVEVAAPPPHVPTRPDAKIRQDKPQPTSVVTAMPAPAPTPPPTTKKPSKIDLLGQD
jgi:outer membrane biosynthesis protein TonB